MPKRDAVDGGHTAFTDHRIQKEAGKVSAKTEARLRLWREVGDAALLERNLGLASIQVGERDGVPELINDGYRRLAAVFSRWPRDADVLSGLGMVLFLKDQKKDAVKLLETAVQARPGDAALHEKLALVRRADANLQGAIASLEKSISLDAGRESAYFFLAECQATAAGREQVLKRLLRVFPQSLLAREALLRSARP
jgi:tetratricopeptide (TPR) repeat protein